MKTNKKFPFLKCFSQEEIKRFPNGWITKSEIAKHVLPDISSNYNDDNLINKIILIKPNIWGQDFMNHKYWKEHTYHPSLTNKDKNTMNTEIFLIGKVIKGTTQEKSKKKSTVKHSLTKMFETVLMCNSSKDQANEFSEKQCLDMLLKNIKLDENLIMSSPICKTEENDLLIEPDQLIHGNEDAKSNDDKVEVNVENNQASQESIRKRKLASIARKISPKNKSTQQRKQINTESHDSEKKKTNFMIDGNVDVDSNDLVQVKVENNQPFPENTSERTLASSARKISPKKKSTQQRKQTNIESNNSEKKKTDFMIHQRVAFDFHSPDFQTHIKDWDKKSVKDHIHHLLEDGQHIRGIIDSKAKKQKGQEHTDYIICWEFCTTGIKNIQISMQEAFAATHLSKQLERNEHSEKISDYDYNEKTIKNDFNS